MKSRTARQFRELFRALPKQTQRQAREAYQWFLLDHRHPGLRFKQVRAVPPLWSARVGIGYRAVGVVARDTIVWFWIGSHSDYDKLLRQM